MTTRVLSESRAATLAIPRAVLKVVRGPDKGLRLEFGDRTAAVIGSSDDADLVLRDDSVSSRHAELRFTDAGFVLRDLGSTNGTEIQGLRIHEVELPPTSTFKVGVTELRMTIDRAETRHPLSANSGFGGVVGRCAEMRRIYATLEAAAPTEASVLIEGESGVGKEAIAEGLHRASARRDGPFVVVDCGAIPAALFESELFGHERGAFTGAVTARAGLFEQAAGGTLFLDEIGELPVEEQPKLLRALEAKQVRRLGATAFTATDVRVVAATCRNLEQQVKLGAFRSDLFYRLAVIRVHVPPLRHRVQDLPAITKALCARMRPNEDPDVLLAPHILAAFSGYAWPGNVRELRNVIERLLIAGDLPTRVRESGSLRPYAEARKEMIERFERSYAETMLSAAGGVVARAAANAGISRQTFYRLLGQGQLDDDR